MEASNEDALGLLRSSQFIAAQAAALVCEPHASAAILCHDLAGSDLRETKMASATSDHSWMAKWLDAVQDGSAKMSQRARSSIDRNGGIDAAVAAARARGVHLVELTDDGGNLLVAASLHSFRPLC